LGSSVLSGGTASTAGTYAFTTPSTAPIAGTLSQNVTFTPTDTANYNTASTTASVTVNKATQTITGLAPTQSKIYGDYGGIYMDFDLTATKGASTSALSYSSSNTGVATIHPTTGSVHIVGAGTTTLTVNQAADANYNAAPAVTQTLTVSKTAITLAADAKSKTYGATDPDLTYQITTGALVGSDVLAGSLSRVAGEDVGTYAISSTLGNANYDVTFVPNNLTIGKADATVAWPTAAAITYGDALSAATLTGGTGEGTFAFTNPSTVPHAGVAESFEVTFTPTSANYKAATQMVSVMVNKATPTILVVSTASPITYGQTLASSVLSGGTASVAGSFAFSTT
jgi:hypothetical protein